MKLQIDDKLFKFSFEHRKTGTVCRCEYDGKTYASGSQLAPGDQFQKAKGRRVALGRLLKMGLQELVPVSADTFDARAPISFDPLFPRLKWSPLITFTRLMRKHIWMAYFQQHADLGKKDKLTRIRLPFTGVFVDVPGEHEDVDAALKAYLEGR